MIFDKNMLSLYIVTDEACVDDMIGAEIVAKNGATAIQLRNKNSETRDLLHKAIKIKEICQYYHIPFFVNDRLDIAVASNADGIHIGQKDMPIKYVKKIAPNLIVGVSASNLFEAKNAEKEGADYIGAGAIFPTKTKMNALVLPINDLIYMKKMIQIPIVAIGGINFDTIDSVLETGVDGVAIISAILNSNDIANKTKEMKNKIQNYRKGFYEL